MYDYGSHWAPRVQLHNITLAKVIRSPTLIMPSTSIYNTNSVPSMSKNLPEVLTLIAPLTRPSKIYRSGVSSASCMPNSWATASPLFVCTKPGCITHAVSHGFSECVWNQVVQRGLANAVGAHPARDVGLHLYGRAGVGADGQGLGGAPTLHVSCSFEQRAGR